MNSHNIQVPSFGLATPAFPQFDTMEDLDETMLTGALFGDMNGRGSAGNYSEMVGSGNSAMSAPSGSMSAPSGNGADSGQFEEYSVEKGQGRAWDHPQGRQHDLKAVPQLPPAQPGLLPHHGVPGSAMAAQQGSYHYNNNSNTGAAGGANSTANQQSNTPPLKRGRQATPRAAAAAANKRPATASDQAHNVASSSGTEATTGRASERGNPPSMMPSGLTGQQQQQQPPPKAAGGATGVKAKRAPRVKKTPEQQRADRRERNRRHARCSRARKKLLIDALQNCIKSLQSENRTLKGHATEMFGPAQFSALYEQHDAAVGGQAPQMSSIEDLLAEPGTESHTKALAGGGSTVLEDPDFAFVRALQQGKQNFVITDPHMVDNPIVYATQGFLDLTGYSLDQVLGRNCRFIQGPETDVEEVAKMRKAISEGVDVSVLLLNYRKDGTTFWNQVHCAALRNEYGEIVNYVGVQCQVNPNVANAKAMTSSSSTTSLKSLGSGVGQSFDGDFDDDDDEDDDDDNGA